MRPFAGPLRDRLSGLGATEGAVAVRARRRTWDQAFAPHASRGFFTLKKAIPKILAGRRLV